MGTKSSPLPAAALMLKATNTKTTHKICSSSSTMSQRYSRKRKTLWFQKTFVTYTAYTTYEIQKCTFKRSRNQI